MKVGSALKTWLDKFLVWGNARDSSIKGWLVYIILKYLLTPRF